MFGQHGCGDWGVDQDRELGPDAMRWRPEPAPGMPWLADLLYQPELLGPRALTAVTGPPPAEVDALWQSVGEAFRDLAG